MGVLCYSILSGIALVKLLPQAYATLSDFASAYCITSQTLIDKGCAMYSSTVTDSEAALHTSKGDLRSRR
jgi:hypothetical protein